MIQLTGSYPPRVCGIADYTSHIVDALNAQGLSMEVWTRDSCASRPEAVGVAPDFGPAGIRAVVEKIRATKPKLVHFQYERAIWDQNPAALTVLPRAIKNSGAKLVTTFHALDGPIGWGKAHRLALLPLLALSDDVLVCSQKQLAAVSRIPGVARKTHLTPIGNVIPVTGTRREQAGGEPLRLVYFGFLWKGRNIETLLRALQAVGETGVSATLTLAGAIKEPAYRESLDALATELGVTDRVEFLGETDAAGISEALSGADLCLLPFATGVSTGRTTFTAALAHGVPVVTMSVAENLVPEFVNGENLLYAPVGDEKLYIKAVNEAALRPELRARLADGAKALSARYSWPDLARQILSLPSYREALR